MSFSWIRVKWTSWWWNSFRKWYRNRRRWWTIRGLWKRNGWLLWCTSRIFRFWIWRLTIRIFWFWIWRLAIRIYWFWIWRLTIRILWSRIWRFWEQLFRSIWRSIWEIITNFAKIKIEFQKKIWKKPKNVFRNYRWNIVLLVCFSFLFILKNFCIICYYLLIYFFKYFYSIKKFYK